ncbi:MAG: rhomboid family intramembrane serine protease [Anaerolineae bacterium]|nr:rhomboid family intramembrane serine protease [Anaerolineae bacterium]
MQHEYSDDIPPQQDQPRYPPGLRPPAPRSESGGPGAGPGDEPPLGQMVGSDPQVQQPRPTVRLELPDTKPIFTYILLGLIVVIYLAGLVIPVEPGTVIRGYAITSGEEWMIIQGAKINEYILQNGEYWRLLTSMFLHGGIAHVFFNGWALYVIGMGIERMYGHARFLLIYFLGGLTASIASMMLSPDSISVGASGAIFAIFGAEMVFLYRHRQLFGRLAQARLNNLVMLLLLNLFIGLMGSNFIDNWAHVGGFLAGTALAWFIGPQLTPQLQSLRSGDTPDQERIVRLEDKNPLQGRLFVPFLWAAVLVAVVSVFAAL